MRNMRGNRAADDGADEGPNGRELLREEIIRVAREHPELTPTRIGERVETSHTTVIRVLRGAGLYREPVCVGGHWESASAAR